MNLFEDSMPSLKDHTAPGQALGYYFQLERALSWLAKAPANSIIGIETEDDIVVKLVDGKSIYEQDKSSLSTHPFLPSRKDIWKTLLIWLEAISNDEIDLYNSYFFLITNKSGKNSLAETLSLAKKEVEITKALIILKEKGSQISGDVKILADKVLGFGDTLLKELIKRISFQSGDTLYGEGLRRKLESDLQLDMETTEQNISIIHQLFGWVFSQTVNAWRDKKPAFIDRDAFHREKINIISSYRQTVVDDLIYSLGEVPEVEHRIQRKNIYVQQLQLINCTKDDIYNAIHQYLNSVAKRTFLAMKGYVTEIQLEELDRNLKDHWQSIFRSRKISHKALPPEDIGQIIFFDTTDYDTHIGKYVLKSHFITKGSYHSLANQMKVGWHPEFKAHLKLHGIELKTPKKLRTNA